ncbi:hypothetical protein DRJ27_02025, partial [Candidatus Acetothermia bacterium]
MVPPFADAAFKLKRSSKSIAERVKGTEEALFPWRWIRHARGPRRIPKWWARDKQKGGGKVRPLIRCPKSADDI